MLYPPQQTNKGIPTELPAPPRTKKDTWNELKQKKKHDQANRRAMTAWEANEKARKDSEQQQQLEIHERIARADRLNQEERQQHPDAVADDDIQLPFQEIDDLPPPSTAPASTNQKPRGRRPKASAPPDLIGKPPLARGWVYTNESQEQETSEPPPSTAPACPTTKSGRHQKPKQVWEQAKGHSQQRRPRGPTLKETLKEMHIPVKKKSRHNLQPGQTLVQGLDDRDDTESQQRRLIATAYLIE